MLNTPLISRYNSAYTATLNVNDRDALIESHLPQVKFIAERIASRLPQTVDRDDLIGAGLLGLLDAADKYDPSRGVQFKTYAELRVRGAILDSLRGLDWASRMTRHRARKVEAAGSELEKKLGRPAGEEEIAEFMGIPLSEYQTLLGELRWLTVTSLDEVNEDGHASLAHQIPADSSLIPSALFERAEVREQLIAAIDRLSERERQVIALYYTEELTMKEIGATLGITESRVCQIHTKAVLHLRTALAPQTEKSVANRKRN
jgi:RNA polymerase sigma factor for flagellar operon FliA